MQSLPIVPDEQGQEAEIPNLLQVSKVRKAPSPWKGCSSQGKVQEAGAKEQLTCFVLGRPPLHPDFGDGSDEGVVPIAPTDEVDDLICDVFDRVFIFPNIFCRLQEEAHN